MKAKISALLITCGIATASFAQQVGFTTQLVQNAVGKYAYADFRGPSTGDFNGDGKSDISGYSQSGSSSLSLLVRKSAGLGYEVIKDLKLPGLLGGSIYQHFWSDFNNDGHQDILVKYTNSGATGAVWVSDGAGHYSRITLNLIDLMENIINVDDLNGDGIADFVTIDYNRPPGVDEPSFYAYLSTGVATYAPRQYLHTAKGTTFIGDFDADGRKDIALFDQGSKTDRRGVRMFTHGLDGDLHDNGEIRIGTTYLVTVADLTGDGRTDFIGDFGQVLRTNSPTSVSRVQISGATPQTYANRYFVGDFNGDARTDYLEVGQSFTLGSCYQLYSSGPGGTITSSVTPFDMKIYGNGLNTFSFADDFNGDGRTDIVRINHELDNLPGKISWIRNVPVGP